MKSVTIKRSTKNPKKSTSKQVEKRPKASSSVTTKSGLSVQGVTPRQATKIANAKYDARKSGYRQIGTAVAAESASRTSQAYYDKEARKAEAAAEVRKAEIDADVMKTESSERLRRAGLEDTDKPSLLPDGTTSDPSEQGKKPASNPGFTLYW